MLVMDSPRSKRRNQIETTSITTNKVLTELPLAELVAETILPTEFGTFTFSVFKDRSQPGKDVVVLSNGIRIPKADPQSAHSPINNCDHENVHVRVHDQCVTSEVFGSVKCDCKQQLNAALSHIQQNKGAVIYLQQEGRGIGLANKIKAYAAQTYLGLDTVEANIHINCPVEARTYSCVPWVLDAFRVRSILLMTNNPFKVKSLKDLGVNVVGTISAQTQPTSDLAQDYLDTKRDKMNHMLPNLNATVRHENHKMNLLSKRRPSNTEFKAQLECEAHEPNLHTHPTSQQTQIDCSLGHGLHHSAHKMLESINVSILRRRRQYQHQRPNNLFPTNISSSTQSRRQYQHQRPNNLFPTNISSSTQPTTSSGNAAADDDSTSQRQLPFLTVTYYQTLNGAIGRRSPESLEMHGGHHSTADGGTTEWTRQLHGLHDAIISSVNDIIDNDCLLRQHRQQHSFATNLENILRPSSAIITVSSSSPSTFLDSSDSSTASTNATSFPRSPTQPISSALSSSLSLSSSPIQCIIDPHFRLPTDSSVLEEAKACNRTVLLLCDESYRDSELTLDTTRRLRALESTQAVHFVPTKFGDDDELYLPTALNQLMLHFNITSVVLQGSDVLMIKQTMQQHITEELVDNLIITISPQVLVAQTERAQTTQGLELNLGSNMESFQLGQEIILRSQPLISNIKAKL